MIARANRFMIFALGANLLLWNASAQSQVAFQWDPSPSEGVAGYALWYQTDAESPSSLEVGLQTTTQVNNLLPGRLYNFHVTCYTSEQVHSDPSNMVQFTVPDGEPPTGETNRPPLVQPIANQFADEGRALQFTVQAADPDPDQFLTYSLGQDVPTGATIHTTTGLFTWTPTVTQVPSTNQITLLASDNGSPMMSASQTFTVVARSGTILNVGTVFPNTGVSGSIQVSPLGTLNPEGTKYVYGTSVSATAQANTGTLFSHWILDGVRFTGDAISLAMTANRSLTAYFRKGGSKIKLASGSTTETSLATTSDTALASLTSTANTQPTNTYLLEVSTNATEWTALTNVVAASNEIDTNAIFRIRLAGE